MLVSQHSTRVELEESGHQYGTELAAALVLASRRAGDDIAMKREMAQIVLREIGTAVQALRSASVPASLVAAYEMACRNGVREMLERSLGREPARRAA